MGMEIKNAKIRYTRLEIEDHGILTYWIGLDYGGSGQGFGGFALDGGNPKKFVSCRWIRELLETVGVNRWEDLVGTPIRVEGEAWGPVSKIGHFMEDRWFDQKALFEKERTADQD
jgi:hypothetical protein